MPEVTWRLFVVTPGHVILVMSRSIAQGPAVGEGQGQGGRGQNQWSRVDRVGAEAGA